MLKRLGLAAAALAAVTAALVGGFTGTALANSCSGIVIKVPVYNATNNDINQEAGSQATCAGRWLVEEYWQFQVNPGGPWQNPDGTFATNGTGSSNCHDAGSSEGNENCYNVQTANAWGYFGAGNQGGFKDDGLGYSGVNVTKLCNFSWRIEAVLYDWSTAQPISTAANIRPAGC